MKKDFKKNKIILILGIMIGGGLIYIGIKKQNNVNAKYSNESKASIAKQLASEKQRKLKKEDILNILKEKIIYLKN